MLDESACSLACHRPFCLLSGSVEAPTSESPRPTIRNGRELAAL